MAQAQIARTDTVEGLGGETQGLGERERETEVVAGPGQHVSAPLAGRPDKG